MSTFARGILRGSTNLWFPLICGKAAVEQGNVSVEVLLPKSGHRLQLSCSGWSGVLGVDADGGPPDGDFTDECHARVAARRCPYRLFTALAGAISNLISQVDNKLRPLRQVLTPNVMIMKPRQYAGKPG